MLALNRIIALFGFIIISPLFLLLSVLVLCFSGWPVFFIQDRIGMNGKSFKIYKFRTMIKNADREKARWQIENPKLWAEYQKNNFKLKKDNRVTLIGKFLRKTSLDELPQLLNIITGKMNFIGPRPLLESEISSYGKSFRYYIRVKPGVTGLWQVSGRSNTSFRKRITYDRYYVLHYSWRLDLRILAKTFITIFFARGAF